MTDHLDPSDSTIPQPPDPWDAIGRFLAGESSAGDAAEIRQWLSEHPGDAHTLASLDALLPPSASDAGLQNGRGSDSRSDGTLQFGRAIDVEAALRRLHAQLQTGVPPSTLLVAGSSGNRSGSRGGAVPASRSWRIKASWAVAATVIAAVAIASFRSGDAASSVAKSYDAPVGARNSVMLSDGSNVILAPGSRLIVAASYGQSQREVELQGAAQFTVRHDENHPFLVRTGAAVIRDLGTIFTVRSMPGATVVVAVMEGSVALSDSTNDGSAKAITLAAGDRGRLQASGVLDMDRGSVTPDESAWVTGRLVYRDAPLSEVQADLRRWYGVELVVGDSALSALSITTEGMASDSVEKLVGKLTTMWGAVATRRGDTLFVDRSGDRPKY